MNGFSVLFRKRRDISFISNGDNKRKIEEEDFIAYNNMIPKFENDKIFYNNQQYLLILDGIILNKEKLINDNENWTAYLIDEYKKSDLFFNELRGSFSGVIYDKEKKKIIVFSDQIGSKFLFYYVNDEIIFVSSQMQEVYSFLKQNNIQYSLSVENAYLILSYGFTIEDRTICNKIKKLEPGSYLIRESEQEKMVQKDYYLIDNEPDYTITEDDAIELLDTEFCRAIKLEFDHDINNGYKTHFVSLSGGLDSRMVCWVAHQLGYVNQVNFTFSQTNYLDESIPQQISSDLKHEWIFKSLDSGTWLKNIDEVTKESGGNVLYYTLGHELSLNKYINMQNFGTIHSGQLGDAIFGASLAKSKNQNDKFELGDGAYSTRYLSKIDGLQLHRNYKNVEIANLYYRGFSGANGCCVCTNSYNEMVSPFTNIDLMENTLKIPIKMRYKHYIYKKWILSKYPKAADYIWEKSGTKIGRKFGIIRYGTHEVPIEQIWRKIQYKYFGKKAENDNKSMNPYGYYMDTNSDLSNYLMNYFKSNMYCVSDKNLSNLLTDIMNSNNHMEMIQALSVISASKIFFE